MSATIVTAATLTRLLTPVINDLYKGAKDKVKGELSKWSTASGIKKIATTLVKIEKVKTIWSPEDEKPLSKFYYPSKIYDRNATETINKFDDLPDGNLVIEGIVGQGKSIFMRYLAASLISAEKPNILPVFIELRNISTKRSLTDTIEIFLKSINVKYSQETFDYLASSEKLALILDGFDEIPNNCVADTILELQSLQTLHPNLKIIISSRPHSHIQNVTGFKVVKLRELNDDDYAPFISKLITNATKKHEVLSALIECTPGVKGLINTPLMLTLVVIIYQTEKEIPSSLSEFFDKLFGVVFAKHDRLKAGFNRQHHSGLSESKLKKVFEAFCFLSIQHGIGRSMTEAQFDKSFEGAIAYTPEFKCDNEGFKKDIIKVSCLMIEEGIDTITFLHKSILDYHAAAFIRNLTDTQADRFYAAAYNHFDRWGHVLEFLKTIDKLRYTKNYIIRNVPNDLADIRKITEHGDARELKIYLAKLIPNGVMSIKSGEPVKFSRTVSKQTEFQNLVADQLANGFFALCKNASATHLSDVVKRAPVEEEGIPQLTVNTMLDEFDDSEIMDIFKESELSISELLASSTAYIEAENKKNDLFIDILSSDNPI